VRPVVLPRRERAGVAVPLTPLVDVLLILLIFFMVTSTYLDLDMIPMSQPEDVPLATVPAAHAGTARVVVLVRLDAAGAAHLGGRQLAGPELQAEIGRRLAPALGAAVLVLPSAQASVQALVDLLGGLSAAGATRVQVLSADPEPAR
jgi:biopolymer transport protein ExbD